MVLSALASAQRPADCIRFCPAEYNPICGKPADGRGPDTTFGNRCLFDNYNCNKSGRRKILVIVDFLDISNSFDFFRICKMVWWPLPWRSASSEGISIRLKNCKQIPETLPMHTVADDTRVYLIILFNIYYRISYQITVTAEAIWNVNLWTYTK